MNTSIIVDTDENGNPIIPEEAQSTETAAVKEAEGEVKAEPTDRFSSWDKDVAVTNYKELEQFNSRQAQELGQLRQQVASMAKPEVPATPEGIDVDALLDDPQAAIARVTANNPEMAEMRRELTGMRNTASLDKLRVSHPDFLDIVNTAQFNNWVSESPMRGEMHIRATNYDYDAGNELLNNFKAQQQTQRVSEAQTQVEDSRKTALRDASSEGASSGSGTAAKVFNQHELIELNRTNPEKYDAMLPEIMQAYADKRVRGA